jgi:hypothetical protein
VEHTGGDTVIDGLELADELRLENPELAGELDDVIVAMVRDLPADCARAQVRVVAGMVTDIRAGRRQRPQEGK